jgi:hypothetical protein
MEAEEVLGTLQETGEMAQGGACITQEQARALVDAAEQAMTDNGWTFTRIRKSKRYEVKTGPNADPKIWIVRTSTKRELAFDSGGGRWPTLGDERIDKVLIAAFDDAKHPTAKVVYPPIARTDLLPRFVEIRTEWQRRGNNNEDPRLFVKLDRRDSTKAGSNVASGITEGMTPIASYPLEPHLVSVEAATPARRPRGRPRRAPQSQEAEHPAPAEPAWRIRAHAEPNDTKPLSGKSAISMVIDLDEDEHAELAARYARRLEVDPRRLRVEVRLTVVM